MVLTAIASFLFCVYNGPIAAAIDEMGPRSYATALQASFLLATALLGNAPAPLIIGRLSDLARGHVAARSRWRWWDRWRRLSCRAWRS